MFEDKILKLAINKAIKGGYKWGSINNPDFIQGMYYGYYSNSFERLIFSHDFAKTFWGNKLVCENGMEIVWGDSCPDDKECWQYHLQRMVLEPEPLKYLEKFL